MKRLLPTQKKSRTTRCKNVLTVWSSGRKIQTAHVRLSYTMTQLRTHSDSDRYILMAERVLSEVCFTTDSPTNRLLYCWILFTGGVYILRMLHSYKWKSQLRSVRHRLKLAFLMSFMGLEKLSSNSRQGYIHLRDFLLGYTMLRRNLQPSLLSLYL